MAGEFSFEIDRAAKLVRIRMRGLFTLDDIDAFLKARQAAHAQLGCAPNDHMTLNDVREMSIQLQEVVGAFQQMLSAPEYRSRRLAFVAAPTLARSQLMRALASREARCFEDMASAERWLFVKNLEESPPQRRVG